LTWFRTPGDIAGAESRIAFPNGRLSAGFRASSRPGLRSTRRFVAEQLLVEGVVFGVEADENDFQFRRLPRKEFPHFRNGYLGGAVLGKAEDPGADVGEGDGADLVLHRQSQAVTV